MFVSLCVCVCVCAHVCVSLYVCVCMCIYHMCVCVCVCAHVHVAVCVCACVCISLCVCVCVCVCVCFQNIPEDWSLDMLENFMEVVTKAALEDNGVEYFLAISHTVLLTFTEPLTGTVTKSLLEYCRK